MKPRNNKSYALTNLLPLGFLLFTTTLLITKCNASQGKRVLQLFHLLNEEIKNQSERRNLNKRKKRSYEQNKITNDGRERKINWELYTTKCLPKSIFRGIDLNLNKYRASEILSK